MYVLKQDYPLLQFVQFFRTHNMLPFSLFAGDRVLEMNREVIAERIGPPGSGRGIGGHFRAGAVMADDRSLKPAVLVGCAEIEEEM